MRSLTHTGKWKKCFRCSRDLGRIRHLESTESGKMCGMNTINYIIFMTYNYLHSIIGRIRVATIAKVAGLQGASFR